MSKSLKNFITIEVSDAAEISSTSGKAADVQYVRFPGDRMRFKPGAQDSFVWLS